MTMSGGGILLRENPTLQSTANSSIPPTRGPGGPYSIPSFFHVFIELSIDGGNTWLPATSSNHMELLEPGTWILAGTALLAIAWTGRRA